MRRLPTISLVFLFVLQAGAALADEAASGTASPDPAASAAAETGSTLAGYLWGVLNAWLITIIDVATALWPSTPSAIKLSTLLSGLVASYPSAPWWLVSTFVSTLVFVLGVIGTIKAWKLIWP